MGWTDFGSEDCLAAVSGVGVGSSGRRTRIVNSVVSNVDFLRKDYKLIGLRNNIRTCLYGSFGIRPNHEAIRCQNFRVQLKDH